MLPSEKAILFNVIEMYKDRPYLWNKSHRDYRNRELRNEGNKALFEVYKEYDARSTVRGVVKKLQNLRTTFLKEYKKVRTSIRSGDEKVYEPTLWYYDAMSFLACIPSRLDPNTENTSNLDCTLQSDYEDNSSTSSHKNESIHETIHIPIHMPIEPTHEPIRAPSPELIREPIREQIHEARHEPIHESIRETIHVAPMIKKPRLMKVIKKEIDDIYSMPRECKMTNNEETNKEDENECELYAQLLARKLKKVEEDQRLVLMNEIDNLVFKAIMASKSRNSGVFFTMVDPNMDEEV